jgi:probable addiction module antidote protein
MENSISHDEAMAGFYRADPAFAAQLLDAVMADGDQTEIMLTLRQMADAFGGVGYLADATKFNRNSMYTMLSEKGNPLFSTMSTILKAMGLRLSVQPLQPLQPPLQIA